MNSKCYYCGKEATVRIPYARLSLCVEHFSRFVIDRVEDTIRRYRMAKPGDRILLALSGGKDSSSLAHIMHLLSNSMGFRLMALHIDLGIGGYSKRSREVVESICRRLSLELVLVDLKRDLGFNLRDFVQKARSRRICSLCGMVKRYTMNAVAVELGIDAVATAHHADDVLVYVFKNFIMQDYDHMRKLLPVNRGVSETVATRIKPLYEVYERDLALYAKHLGIDFVDAECPYRKEKGVETAIRGFLEDLEARAPGIKISILRKFAKSHSAVSEDAGAYNRCSSCGLISLRDRCVFCRLTEKCFGRSLGSAFREILREKYGAIFKA